MTTNNIDPDDTKTIGACLTIIGFILMPIAVGFCYGIGLGIITAALLCFLIGLIIMN